MSYNAAVTGLSWRTWHDLPLPHLSPNPRACVRCQQLVARLAS